MIKKIRGKIDNDIHLMELLKGSVITFFIKITGMVGGYVVIYLISKKNGAEGVGVYNLFVKTLMILGAFCSLGMNVSMLRFIGQFNNENEKSKLHKLYKHVYTLVIPITIFIGVMIFFLSDIITNIIWNSKQYEFVLIMIGLIIPFFTLNQINIEFLRGLKKLQISEFLRSLSRPLILITLMFFFYNRTINNIEILYFFISGIIFNFILSSITISVQLRKISNSIFFKFSLGELLKTSLPMMVTSISSMLIFYLPLIFISFYGATRDVGIYSVVFQISLVVSTLLIIVNTIAGPKYAEMYWNGDKKKLQDLIKTVTKIMFWLSLSMSFVILIFSNTILRFFGEEYLEGRIALIFLILGQFVNTITGSASLMLNMAGEQKILQVIILITVSLCAIGYFFLIPSFGINGGAFMYMFGVIFLNISSVFYAKQKLNISIYSLPF